MKGDPRVIDVLNEALRLDLAAINLYWLQHRLLDHWGFTHLGQKGREVSG